jgi:hypothetical protein
MGTESFGSLMYKHQKDGRAAEGNNLGLLGLFAI